nr:helix-turn-helix domain-containing protein [Thiolinea sp.]
MSPAAPKAPVVRIYGENQEQDNPDFLHVELLLERSSRHEFKIRPHRHNGLHQLFFLSTGSGVAHLDGEETCLQAPCLLVVCEMCVHDFQWEPAVSGNVLTLARPLCQRLEQHLRTPLQALTQTRLYTLDAPALTGLTQLFEQLLVEYQRQAPARIAALEALLSLLLVRLARLGERSHPAREESGRSGRYLQAFGALIETHHQQQQPVSFYAERLGITPTYLNALCRELSGQSALALIHGRLLVAAKRSLIYSDTGISEIAWALNFSEPAYFSRF